MLGGEYMKNLDKINIIFFISEEDKKIIKKIEHGLSLIKVDDKIKEKNLQIKARVRSIHSSLAIEANSLPLKSVESILENKMVLGDRKEIQEVRNANELYEHIDDYNWKSESDFLKAHTLMMKYFEDDGGFYRNHGEGVRKGNQIIYRAPDFIFVPNLMKSLFDFINENADKIHPLVLSAIFHYYLVYVHPFSDGNGRLARFWTSLMLMDWNTNFKYIPIEEEIYLNQEHYYDAIAQCHVNGNANIFIHFMLNVINNIIEKTTQKTTQKLNSNQEKIIELIRQNPKITRKEMALKLGITEDGVKYNLKKLSVNNIIERVGSDNGGYWSINN